VAVDRRAALALEQYAAARAARPAAAPDDAPAAADAVWLLRFKPYTGRPAGVGRRRAAAGCGLRVVEEQAFDGSSVQMVVQRWARRRLARQ
jgi:hypothetical protein